MTRDLRRLADTRFDLVVVGAGIYGAIAAWDAALRGLSVALIDKDDFGSATSFNNLKTLHGGLRSLQALNLPQMRLFIRERRALARIAPHLVQPMPFIVPTYAHPLRAAITMRVALALNDIVSRDRHRGLTDPALRLPPGGIVSRDACLRMNPLIDPTGVTGGALWHDYQMHNSDRMTFSFVLSAAEKGAVTANYAKAIGILREGARVRGVRVEDAVTSDVFEVRCDAVLNATGGWAASFLGSLGGVLTTPAPRLSRAMNLVVRQVQVSQGCGGRSRGRFLFLVPWRHVSLVGTSHEVYDGAPDGLDVTRADLDAFVADAREAFPRAALKASDVGLVHRGLLPMLSGRGHHVKLLRESTVVDHTRDGTAGLLSVFGVRYTTARHTAALAIDAVFRHRGVGQPPPCQTDTTPVVGGAISDKEDFVRTALARQLGGTTSDMVRRLAITYGTGYDRVLQLLHERPALAEPLGRDCAVSGAEVLFAARHESAVTLADALIRRTEAGSAGYPGHDAIRRAAAIMAHERGWRATETDNEVGRVEAFYHLPS